MSDSQVDRALNSKNLFDFKKPIVGTELMESCIILESIRYTVESNGGVTHCMPPSRKPCQHIMDIANLFINNIPVNDHFLSFPLLHAELTNLVSISITFGSVGDITSICLLAKDLVACVDESRGSSSEYKKLRHKL